VAFRPEPAGSDLPDFDDSSFAEVADHLGGYLPFSVKLTGLLRPRGNVLAVRLDSGFNLNVPPDRPAPEPSVPVDYWQPGGIYRDVRLRVVPRVFLADVFAKPVNVLDPAARQVVVQATVDAASGPRFGAGPRPSGARRASFDE
jgi:beta-galactosidase